MLNAALSEQWSTNSRPWQGWLVLYPSKSTPVAPLKGHQIKQCLKEHYHVKHTFCYAPPAFKWCTAGKIFMCEVKTKDLYICASFHKCSRGHKCGQLSTEGRQGPNCRKLLESSACWILAYNHLDFVRKPGSPWCADQLQLPNQPSGSGLDWGLASLFTGVIPQPAHSKAPSFITILKDCDLDWHTS